MNYSDLSKEISYALRHAPWEYELELDTEGWVEIQQLLRALEETGKWQGLGQSDLVRMIELSDKKRHEVGNGKIRALYGHSVPQKISREPSPPPEILYHGTARRFVASIREQGLLPQGRQYVHLSIDRETALQVGKRRDDEPVLLVIQALEAHRGNVPFYIGNDKVWLADFVPSGYIKVGEHLV